MLASAESLPDAPEARRAPLERRAVLPERAPRRPGAQGAPRALIEAHPADPLAQKALFRVAAGYHQLAYYSKAAENYEDFAKKFPGEKKATDALGNATTFRIGLSESDKALADMKSFVEFYGKRQAAGRRRRVLPDGRRLREGQARWTSCAQAPRELPQVWGAQGGLDRQVVAHFRLGELALEGVVPEGVGGRRLPPAHPRLGDGPPEGPRRPQQEAQEGQEAAREVAHAVRPAHQVEDHALRPRKAPGQQGARSTSRPSSRSGTRARPPRRSPDKDVEARAGSAAYAVAGRGLLHRRGLVRELPPHQVPGGPRLPAAVRRTTRPRRRRPRRRRPRSRARSSTPTSTRRPRRSTRRAREYLDVFGMKQAQWTIASAARVGQITATSPASSTRPRSPRTSRSRTSGATSLARDLLRRARGQGRARSRRRPSTASRSCLKAATEQSWYNEWSRLCERELNQMKPSEYPLSSEVKPEAGYVSTNMSPTPVVPELSEAVQTKAGK